MNYSICISENEMTKKWFGSDVMYIGVDVNHLLPQSRMDRIRGVPPSEPSVVGFVANTGATFQFTGDYRFQNSRVEVIVEGMDLLMEDFLERFTAGGRSLPKRIVHF